VTKFLSSDQNYFSLFEISCDFEVDLEPVRETFLSLQRKFHPDQFSASDESEQLAALHSSSLLNDAYETISSPLKRAAYLLGLSGIDVEQTSQKDLGMELLMEQMELREVLGTLPDGEQGLEELETLQNAVSEKVASCQLEFGKALAKNDLLGSKRLYHKLQFLIKLTTEITEDEDRRLGLG
jgi:molecular chaperone HscB